MKIKELTSYLEEIAPLHFQEDYDNAGLIVGDEEAEVEAALISLDVTEAVVDEAISLGCSLIISHHPIVFRGLKRFNGANYVERVVIKAIKNNIALYAIHTNLDNVYLDGVNTKIAEKIGLLNTKILSSKPDKYWNNEAVGSGMIGDLSSPMSELDFMNHLKKSMALKYFKHTPLVDREIEKVAVCGGSGGFLLKDAIREGAQIFITADYKYHEFFDAEGRIIIADIGHYESEIFTVELLYQLITKKFSNFAAHCTKVNTNPINYF